MKNIKSIIKKAANLDVAAYLEGKENLESGGMEQEAYARSRVCAGCDRNVDEPIDELKVIDTIPVISKRMCSACGCSLPYLLRQNRKHCKLKKW